MMGSYVSLTFDINQASRYVRGRLKDIFMQGMTAWVEEAKSNIPVWSGASRAALTQVAGFVGVPVFGPGRGTGSAHSNEIVAHPPVAKHSPADGANSEHFEVDADGNTGRFKFRWSSDLFHLNVNERINVNEFPHFHLVQPGPYELRKKCNDAWRRVVNAELDRFVFRIRSFINFRRFKIGG